DGRLTLDSLVWFEGLNSWERAGLLSGLEDLFLKQLTGDILSSLQKAAEQDFSIQVFIARNNRHYGPYSYDQCREGVKDGRLTLDSLVWFEGLNSWERAGLLSGLEDLFLKQLTGDILSSLQKAAEQDFSIQVFIARNNRHYGPYSYDQCREGVKDGWLTQDSLVWFEGLNSWEHAHMLTALQSMFV
ncbi:DUF4339 domain-containing protein, partial [Bacteroides eggerthii]|nr:DUF4339 domain-containing protein [Bacteroides eggerthii]